MTTLRKNKVYAVTIDFTDLATFDEVMGNTFALERDIAIIAKKAGTEIHFHQFQVQVEGPPAVLLECPKEFLDSVKKLPAFGSVQELPPHIPTIRVSDLPQIEPPEAQFGPMQPQPPVKQNRPKPKKGPFGI